MSNFIVRKAAVLGAGVMGAQIAAHLVNADVPVVLFDLPDREGDPNGIVRKALDGLKKLEPSPLGAKDKVAYIDAANYESGLELLRGCDLVIEAIAERMDWKHDLYRKVAPFIAPHAIFATNTSGLSINRLAEPLPAGLRGRFCGVHFFNPPRYMKLVELIPARHSDAAMLDNLESFLTTTLGKGVIRAFDTPNFIANRVGVFSILAVMHHTERLGLGFDTVDALTGPLIGRPKSATYRTADVVGLDTLAHVIKTMEDNLAADPWHKYYKAPGWLQLLIQKGALGQKTKAGIYRKDGKEIKVVDLGLQDYRAAAGQVEPEVEAILKLKNPAEKFDKLCAHSSPQAQFLWAIFRDVFHYVAVHLGDIADNARDLDLAMRWGFGWAQGPFETWQAAGWQAIADAVKQDIAAGRAMAQAPLPAWVFDGRQGVHGKAGSWSAKESADRPRSALPVYRRQYFPERVLGEAQDAGETLFENEGVRLWRTGDELGRRVAVASFKSKGGAIGPEVVEGMLEAIARAEKDYSALVIWQPQPPFSFGANLKAMSGFIQNRDFAAFEQFGKRFHEMVLRIKYAQVPVVAAVNGMALGGGCEIVMHAARTVAAFESYIGLVEAGVGLIPGGGGCKEIALRAHQTALATANKDLMQTIQPMFMTVAQATVSKSALEARELGFLRPADQVVFHADELLHAAQRTALGMAEAGYRPPLPPRGIRVAGRPGIATLELALVNMRDGGMISEHDYKVGRALAVAVCGGEVEAGTLVDEKWLLAVEGQQFIALLQTEKTLARIKHTLETGKPLRN
ncbi:MAG: 3-hydroxyacyl-CoA dehydrogenase/enoyl-CoA hydratase family protein [Pseudomonadota bacterium]